MTMKKIALIEDRYNRQIGFLEQNGFLLDNYTDILENFVLGKADKLLEDIISDNFDLNEYDIIISHKSVELKGKNNTNTTIIDKLTNFCEERGKMLVLFSGGIDANYYRENYLELNSQTFYSQNLKLFLDAIKNDDENILILCYGLKWKINILLNTLEKIDKESEKYKRFAKDCKIELLDSLGLDVEKPQKDAQNISITEMGKYRDVIYTSIKESVIYE